MGDDEVNHNNILSDFCIIICLQRFLKKIADIGRPVEVTTGQHVGSVDPVVLCQDAAISLSSFFHCIQK